MTIQDFIRYMKRTVAEDLAQSRGEEYQVDSREVIKTNDRVLHALVISRKGSRAGVNVYMDDLFRRHENGEDFSDLGREAVTMVTEALSFPIPPSAMIGSLGLEDIRKRLTLRLIDVTRNCSYMADLPYIELESGLAMIAEINEDESICSEWRIVVTKGLLKMIGCEAEELFTAALQNMISIEPPVLMRLADIALNASGPELLSSSEHGRESEEPLCLTNTSRYKGAAALFYPGVMEKAADLIGGAYYVVPSSIHEVLLVPEESVPDASRLSAMLKCANREVIVDECDILSDNVFRFDPAAGKLAVADVMCYDSVCQ